MDLLRRAASRVASLSRNLFRRQAVDDDLDAEVRATIDLFVDEQVRAGIDPLEARRLATVQLGRVASIKTQVREARSGAGLETVWYDVTFGARLLRRNPLFASTAMLSLAVGIGATTTMFSLANALLLRDVQVAAPRQLVEVWRTTQFGSGTRTANGARVGGALREAVSSMNPNLPILAARALDDPQGNPSVTQLRIGAMVSVSVGGLGLLLASIGIYGVTVPVRQATRISAVEALRYE